MVALIVRWLVTALAILMLPSLFSSIEVKDFGTALAAAAVLAVLNVLVKPLLILLTLPLTFLSLGLFLLVINAIVFELAGALVSGLHIGSFWGALGASLVVSFVSSIANSVGDRRMRFSIRRATAFQPGPSRTVDMHKTDDGKWE